MGGPDGATPGESARLTERLTLRDIELVKNPSTSNGSNEVIYINNIIDASFDNCISPRPVPSMVAHMRFFGGVIKTSEPDKIMSTLIFDQVTSGEVGGATGVEFYLIRNSKIVPIQVSPRQLRIMDTTIDATTNTHFYYPMTWAYNGNVLLAEFESTQFKINPTGGDPRIMPAIQSATAVLGRDATWSGNTLVIPRNSSQFLDWQVWIFPRAVICGNANCSSWGIVTGVTSPTGGGSIRLAVQWKAGTKPVSGTVSAGRGYSLRIDGNSKLVGKAAWDDKSGGFVLESLPASFGPSTTGPYPPLDSSFE
jgi:hypothetical protein